MKRRGFLKLGLGAVAAPFVITTPGLLMKVHAAPVPRIVTLTATYGDLTAFGEMTTYINVCTDPDGFAELMRLTNEVLEQALWTRLNPPLFMGKNGEIKALVYDDLLSKVK